MTIKGASRPNGNPASKQGCKARIRGMWAVQGPGMFHIRAVKSCRFNTLDKTLRIQIHFYKVLTLS